MAEALKDIFKGGRRPNKLWTDRGTEFWNKNVKYELHGPAFNNASVQRLLHTNKIELTDDMGIIMTYPTIDSFSESGIQTINASNMLDIIGSSILQI